MLAFSFLLTSLQAGSEVQFLQGFSSVSVCPPVWSILCNASTVDEFMFYM